MNRYTLTKTDEIKRGAHAAFIDSEYNASFSYRPEFLSNDYKQGKKILSSIEAELSNCDEFCISVAFITMSGITPLLQILRELEEKDVPGKILTTDYLTFSEPKALAKLNQLKNVELKMFCTDNESGGFHTKGYIFRREEIYRIIIGSANLTMNAMTKNREWNTKIVSTSQGAMAKEVLGEFDSFWNDRRSLRYEQFIETYKTKYKIVSQQKAIAAKQKVVDYEQFSLKPNKMQVAFVANIKKIVEQGEKRALLLSSTGTGKTYASAFALREYMPRRALFVVHREQIAKQAMESYRRVFGEVKTFGLLSGNEKNYDSDFLFSTMQMMCKEETLQRFSREEFDIIVVDEVHRAGAGSYQKIMNYFEPELWLGMTASPDRTDGFDIYNLFDHNIAYEIRLQQALEEDLLCPFHYFGLTDLEINGETFDDNSGLRNFARLVSADRVEHIIEKIKYYDYSGSRVKGLVFCSRKDEGRELSRAFNMRGYNTEFICGEDSQSKREDCIDRLTSDIRPDKLDYIFTVDIFNEGVDIPEINQVVMLRPTESPIIFVQQLGRGLRKAPGKEYVVILDFIGNYTNNFMIPIALSGDRTYNKDTIRRYVREGSRVIPGNSTIHFDEISRKRIFQSIDSANFNDIKLIKECYQQLKFKLGRVPALMDFEEYGSIDVLRIFDNKSLGSYHMFLKKYEKEYVVKFSNQQEKMLEFISKKFASGKRPHELLVIKGLLEGAESVIEKLRADLQDDYGINMTRRTEVNVVNVLTNEFATGSARDTYRDCAIIEKTENEYKISEIFKQMLEDDRFYDQVEKIVEFGLYRNRKDYSDTYKDTSLKLYSKYTYEDVCRLLEWEKGEVALNIGGYKYDRKTKTYPVFINYDKTEDISDTIRYEDRFENQGSLVAISKSGRTVESEDVYTALHAEELGINMELFVRKNKDDKISKEFYYLGRINATGETHEFTMPNTDKSAVEITYALETPVRDDIYDYLVG